MKKRYIILIVIALAVAGLCFHQRNNIKAIIIFATHSTEDTEKLIQKNKEELNESLKKYSEYIPRDLTSEEEEKIASGELSVEEAAEILLKEASEEEEKAADGSNSASRPSSSGNENTSVNKETDKSASVIKRYTAELYSMKAYYMGQLSQIESRARSEYSAMSSTEKKNLSKAAFVGKYAGYATTLMGECDGKVNSLLSSMKAELTSVGGDTSIISAIRQAYENEKAARKAYYLNMVA